MKKKSLILASTSLLALGIVAVSASTKFGLFDNSFAQSTWRHYSAKSAECAEFGTKEYWTDCSGNTTIEDPSQPTATEMGVPSDADVATIISTYGESDERLTIHAHALNSKGFCNICGAYSISNSDYFQSIAENSSVTAPAGFNKVYDVTPSADGNAGIFNFSEQSLTPTDSSKMQFAVLMKAGMNFGFQGDTTSWKFYGLESVTADTWVRFTITKDEGVWTATNSTGKFKDNGGTLHDYVVFGTPSYAKLRALLGLRTENCAGVAIQMTEFVFIPDEFDSETQHVHNWLDGQCTLCSAKELDYNQTLLTPSNMAESSDYTAPGAFAKVYKYNAECGGAYNSMNFFKHGGNPLTGVVEFNFSILTDRNNMFYLRSRQADGNIKAMRLPYQRYDGANNPVGWVDVKYQRTDASSNVWHITTSQPEGSGAGTALDYSVTISESGMVNSLWGVCMITNQKDSTWVPIYITEFATKDANFHYHDWEFLGETNSTCAEHGYIRYSKCSICNQSIDVTKPYAEHSYGTDDTCTICHKKIFSYADHLQSPDHISLVTDGSVAKAAGFSRVYYYDTTTGGGTSGGFLKHEGNVGLGNWESPRIQKMEFAVKAYDDNSNIRIRNNNGGAQHSLGSCADWVYVTFTLDSVNNKYICTNTVNTDVVTCDGNGTMFAIYQLLNDSSMYVTEYLLGY